MVNDYLKVEIRPFGDKMRFRAETVIKGQICCCETYMERKDFEVKFKDYLAVAEKAIMEISLKIVDEMDELIKKQEGSGKPAGDERPKGE